MRLTPLAVLAVALGLVVAAANAADLLFLDYFGPLILLPYALGTFAGVGLIVALRRAGHPIGWLFLAAGVCFALDFSNRAYAWRALVDAPGTLPGGELALVLTTLTGPLRLAALSFATVFFPTGRPPSRRWVAVIVVGVVAIAARTVAQAFAVTSIRLPYALNTPRSDMPTVPNPAAISGPIGEMLAALIPVIDAAAGPFILVAGLGLVVRFVRSRGIERLQLKWFVYATSLALGLFAVAGILHSGTLSGVFWVLSQLFEGLIPVAVGIAVLRYRLYDIDVLINRTVVYGATTAAIGATFFVGLVALQTVLRPFTNGSDLAVAASTLISFALFRPIRRRIQDAVDRRFDRIRYHPARMVGSLADLLRDEVDLDALQVELVDAVRKTMAPAYASLWLRQRPG